MKTYYVGNMLVSDELYHYGIKGQKWGIRRYQNTDGTLTAAGKERYGSQNAQKKFAEKISKSKDLGPGLTKYSPQMKMTIRGISEAANRVKQAEDDNYREIDKFFKNKELYSEYQNKAISQLREYANKNPEEYGYINTLSDKQIKNSDFLQGSFDPYDLFLDSNDKRAKPLQDSFNALIEANDIQQNAASRYANVFLGEYGNMKAKTNTHYYHEGRTVAEKFLYNVELNNYYKRLYGV